MQQSTATAYLWRWSRAHGTYSEKAVVCCTRTAWVESNLFAPGEYVCIQAVCVCVPEPCLEMFPARPGQARRHYDVVRGTMTSAGARLPRRRHTRTTPDLAFAAAGWNKKTFLFINRMACTHTVLVFPCR